MAKRYLLKFLSLILLTGCSGATYIQLGVENKPQNEIPLYDQNVIIVNNSLEQPMSSSVIINIDSLQEHKYEREPINNTYLNIIAEKLHNTNKLNDVAIYNLSMKNEGDNPRKLLSSLQLDSIYTDTGAEWILSLDRLQHVSLITKLTEPFPNAVHQMVIKSDFTLFNYPDTLPIWQSTKLDTLNWSQLYVDYNTPDFIKYLPELNDCIYDAAYINAENCVLDWLPSVSKVDRVFLKSSNPMIREAYDLYIKNDKLGCDIMLEYAIENSKKSKIKQIAYFNRALLAEERGDLDTAISMIQNCIKAEPNRYEIASFVFVDYLTILKTRKKIEQ